MERSQWKFMFGNKFVLAFYKQEQQVSFSTCKKVMVVKKQKLLGKLYDLKVKTKLRENPKQIDMKFGGLGVTKRLGKNIPLYNKVQDKLRLQNELLSKFVVANLKFEENFRQYSCNLDVFEFMVNKTGIQKLKYYILKTKKNV